MAKSKVDAWMEMALAQAEAGTERHDGVNMTIRVTTEKCDCCKSSNHGEFIFKPTGAVVCRACFGE